MRNPSPRRTTLGAFATVLTAGLLLGSGEAAGQPCPGATGPIPNLSFLRPLDNPNELLLSWDPPPGANASTTYVIYVNKASTYCAVEALALKDKGTLTAKTKATSYTLTLDPNTVYTANVLVEGCIWGTNYHATGDSFTTGVATPTETVSNPSPNVAKIDYSYPDRPGDSAEAAYLVRTMGPFRPDGSVSYEGIGSHIFDSCPAKGTFSDNVSAGGFGYYVAGYRLRYYDPKIPTYFNEISPVYAYGGVLVEGACRPSVTPTFTYEAPENDPRAPLVAGDPYLVRWTPSSGLGLDGSYILESSRDPGYYYLDARDIMTGLEAGLDTPYSSKDYTFYYRVYTFQKCGSASVSKERQVLVHGNPDADHAHFIADQAIVYLWGARLEPGPSATVTFTNLGLAAGRLTLHGDPFVDVSPTVLDVPAGGAQSVTVTVKAAAMEHTGAYPGYLIGVWDTGRLDVTLYVQVTPARVLPGSRTGSKVKASKTTLSFSAPAGVNPAPQKVTLTVDPIVGAGPLYLSPLVAPGGSWVSPGSELDSALPASSSVDLTVSVDRSKRIDSDGVPPLRTLMTIVPLGGSLDDAAVIEVLDAETVATVPGGDRGAPPSRAPLAAPPGGSSFIIPTAVKASGKGGAVFTSDGWLRNLSRIPAVVDFYYTPNGQNGLTDAALKTTRTIPGRNTMRLSDLVASLFQSAGSSGQVELRSAGSASLSLRSSVESVTEGNPASRYGTEIPVSAYGSGAINGGGELVIPGVDDDATSRANLILAETTGSAATVQITVYREGGETLGQTTRSVPPYGKIQVDGLVNTVSPGATLSGDSAGVRVVDGSGHVVALATVIDNRSNSFSAVAGRLPGGFSTNPSLILPSGARLTGAFDTKYTTGLAIANGTPSPASLSLTYFYIDVDDHNSVKSVKKDVVIPAHGSLPKSVGADALAILFGVTNRSYGWMKVDGDVSKIVAGVSVSALVDAKDPTKGVKTAQVDGILTDASPVMSAYGGERRFAGLEKSIQRRSNLVLVEITGEPCEVLVRLTSATGATLGERKMTVAGHQYLQVNDIFGNAGLALGEGPFENVEVTARVVSGAGRVAAVASVIDNISRNPEIFVLRAPGP